MKQIIKITLGGILLLFFNNIINAQIDLSGKWQNEFGSAMTLKTNPYPNLAGNPFIGAYASTTGSSGIYQTSVLESNKGISNNGLGITIYWNSADGTTDDNSKYWTSLYQGAAYKDSKSLDPILSVMNFISAPVSFPEVYMFDVGVYPESLTFTFLSKTDPVIDNKIPLPNIEQIKGSWLAGYNEIGLSGLAITGIDQFSLQVVVSQTLEGGFERNLNGIGKVGNSINGLQSISITWTNPDNGNVYGLAGLIDINKGLANFISPITEYNKSAYQTNGLSNLTIYRQ